VLIKRREAWFSLIPSSALGPFGGGVDLWDAGDNSRFRYLIYASGEDVSVGDASGRERCTRLVLRTGPHDRSPTT
jgi:hypothetical protein